MSQKKEEEEPNDTLIELSNDDLAMLSAYFENNMNGTRAWMATHPKAKYNSARVSASEWLTKPNIKNEIKRVLEEKAMGVEEAIARVGAIARADHYPFIEIDKDGFVYFNFADPQAQEHLYLIKKIKTKREKRIDGQGKDAEEWEGEWVEVELHDAHAALRDILKMHGKLSEKVDLSNSDGSLNVPQLSPEKIAEKIAALLALAEERKKNA